ncbi:hypothetical protein ABPG74_009202 [Tetrahymena malaccensis]
MCQILKTQVRVLLSSVHQIINKLPSVKQDQNKLQMQELIKKYNPNSKDDLLKLQKDLQYKINFFKLAYPNIINQVEQQNQEQSSDKENSNKEADKMLHNSEIENLIEQTEEEKNEKIGAGTYVMKDGKLVKGEATKREFVDWSNWFAANVDPEDLKRHKELMDRQHFGGPVWQGKGRPKSIIEDENLYAPGEREMNPYLKQDKEPVFEKVKR